jgi:leucyl/phenylalanyl-tRNA--protein transferase
MYAERYYQFPSTDTADAEGFLTASSYINADLVLSAYHQGIFSWSPPGDIYCWWSPDPRCVIFPNQIKIAKSMRPYLNKRNWQIDINRNVEKVLFHCANVNNRKNTTWLSEKLQHVYLQLAEMGVLYSIETYIDGELSGGFFGAKIGKVFCGESMFSLHPNTSKYALIRFASENPLEISLIDCQLPTPHLMSLGATMISRSEFLSFLSE